EDAFCLPACEFQHLVRYKIIEQDDVGGLQGANRLQCNQLRVARACTHESHVAFRPDIIRKNTNELVGVFGLWSSSERALRQPVPKDAARSKIGESFRYARSD